MCLMNEGRVKVYIDMSICLLYFSQRKSIGEVRNGHGGVEVGLNEWNELTQKIKLILNYVQKILFKQKGIDMIIK